MAEMEHNSDIDSIWDDIDFGDLNLPEDENDIKNSSQDYQNRLTETKIHRHEIINEMIRVLVKPIKKEQKSKNCYRLVVLIVFSIYFLFVTLVTFCLIFNFSKEGFADTEVKISEFLVVGIFANIIGLAVIIFKYLFDEKHSLMKDMISLISQVMTNDLEKKKMNKTKFGGFPFLEILF